MKHWFTFGLSKKDKLVLKNQHLGRKIDKLREQRKKIIEQLKKELGE